MDKHEAFSYPDKECPAHFVDSGRVHECDLPNVHITRHMCYCGVYFDG